MATTVISAFDEFQKNIVNLDPEKSRLARSSRDWLFARIGELPDKHDDFPKLYEENNIAFGSFSRRTKIRPLDDIDMISCLHASGGTYIAHRYNDVRITVNDTSRLKEYCHDQTDILNSRKVINRYVRALSEVPQYRKAEINRRGEAATLQLNSYDWNFDVVPAFITAPDDRGQTYYLIPNGDGHWKKTDPRIDRDRVARINQRHEGYMLNTLRCVKYWQRRKTMPTISSYLLECIVVAHFEKKQGAMSRFVDLELAALFREIANAILGQIQDPKQIQQDINDVDWNDRMSVYSRARSDADKVDEARRLEEQKDMKGSIALWREIFGTEFPEYK